MLTFLKFLVFLSIGILLLYFAFKGINFSKLVDNLKTANYFWVLLGLTCGFVAFFVRAYRWNLLIEPLNYQPTLMNSYHALMIGYMANYAFPRIGEITRCGTLSRIEKIPADKLIGTVIAERAFDLFIFLVLLIVAFVIKINFFGSFFSEHVFKPFFNKIFITFNFSLIFWIILILSACVCLIIVYTFRQKIREITLVKKVGKIGKGVLVGVKSVLAIKRKKEFLVYTVIMWVLYYLMAYLVFFCLPSTSGLSMIDGLFILVVGTCGMVAPVQGGIGAFHSIVSLALILYGISREDGLAYAVIAHESQSIMAILLGIISFFVLFFRSHKNIVSKKVA